MKVVIDEIEYLPVSAAAEHLSTTEMKILMLLRERSLEGELLDGSWYVTADSLAGFDPSTVCRPAEPLLCRTGCSATGCGCH